MYADDGVNLVASEDIAEESPNAVDTVTPSLGTRLRLLLAEAPKTVLQGHSDDQLGEWILE